jgi:cytochrome c
MKLSNLGKIAAGILIFVVLITFLFWYGKGKSFLQPALSLDTPEIAQLKDKRCLEDTAFMRPNHMKLLVTWREAVVREGNRLYTATDGRIFETKLSGTCLKCHSNKQQFCDRCHNYVGVKPNCFSCHIIPAEVRK